MNIDKELLDMLKKLIVYKVLRELIKKLLERLFTKVDALLDMLAKQGDDTRKKRLAGWKEDQEKQFKDMLEEISNYNEKNLAMLKRMMKFVEHDMLADDHQVSRIGDIKPRRTGYGRGQPKKPVECNGQPALTYGYLGSSGVVSRWVARIYFTEEKIPCFAFPYGCMACPESKVYLGTGSGDNNAVSPRDMEDFFKRPDYYLDRDKLKEYIQRGRRR